MTLKTYVNFAGTCAEAFKYYEAHLGGTVTMLMTHREAPGPSRLPADWQDAVLHARISLGETELLGADIPGAEPMRSAYLTLGVQSDADAERVCTALADGGRVLMPLQETFFASRFGQVRDRFGINWMIVHERRGSRRNQRVEIVDIRASSRASSSSGSQVEPSASR